MWHTIVVHTYLSFEPTCAHAQATFLSALLSVCQLVTGKVTTKRKFTRYCRVPPHIGLRGFGGVRTIKRRTWHLWWQQIPYILRIWPWVTYASGLEWTATIYMKIKGHMGKGQRSHWSRSNKDSKERQVGSQQRQVASFAIHITSVIPCNNIRRSLDPKNL